MVFYPIGAKYPAELLGLLIFSMAIGRAELSYLNTKASPPLNVQVLPSTFIVNDSPPSC